MFSQESIYLLCALYRFCLSRHELSFVPLENVVLTISQFYVVHESFIFYHNSRSVVIKIIVLIL